MKTQNVVSFISSKGGSGKTVTSAAIGTFLSALGFRILLVDTDAATNGMTLLFLEQLLGKKRQAESNNEKKLGLFESNGDIPPSPIPITENLIFLPATYSLGNTEKCAIKDFEFSLSFVVEHADADIVLLDAQAGADSFAFVSAGFANTKVIVSEYDPISAQGIERLKILFAGILEPSQTYVLFNKILPEFATAIGEGLSIAHYLQPIAWDADVLRSFARRDLAIDMDQPNAYTLSIAQIAETLFADQCGAAIDVWRRKAANNISAPLEAQLKVLRSRLLSLMKNRDKTHLNRNIVLAFASILGLSATLILSFHKLIPWVNLDYQLTDGQTTGVIVSAVAFLALFIAITVKGVTSSDRVYEAEYKLYEEIRKIESTINSSKAAFRANDSAGIYEKQRRKTTTEQR